MDSYQVLWMFQNLPLLTAQEVHDGSSSVTPCIVVTNDGFCTTKCHHFLMNAAGDSV